MQLNTAVGPWKKELAEAKLIGSGQQVTYISATLRESKITRKKLGYYRITCETISILVLVIVPYNK